MELESLSTNDILHILGEEVRYNSTTRREIGDSVKYGFEMLHQVVSDLKMDKK